MKSLLKKIRPFIIPIVVTLVVLVLFHSIFMLGYVPTESMVCAYGIYGANA